MAESRYSVSPRRTPTAFGPNPRENFSTPMPARLATRKWPSSWTKTRMPTTTTNNRTVWRKPPTWAGVTARRPRPASTLKTVAVIPSPYPSYPPAVPGGGPRWAPNQERETRHPEPPSSRDGRPQRLAHRPVRLQHVLGGG